MDDRLTRENQGTEKPKRSMMEQQRPQFKSYYNTRLCPKHKQQILGICRSPYCDNYRQLCHICRQAHPHNQYLPWSSALKYVDEMLHISQGKLQVNRARIDTVIKSQMQENMRYNMALEQMKKKLELIGKLVQERIEEFKQNVNNIYIQQVRQKLQDLDDIMAKSGETLKKQLQSLNKQPNQSLARFFTKDLEHQIKYYQSYFKQIFIKNTRTFRTALQDDRILTLMVTFQQNLQKIFTFNPQQTNTDHRQFHLFRQEQNGTALYTLSKDGQKIERKQLPKTQTLQYPQKQKLQYDYEWHGIPQSLFYKPNNCYYIIGQGSKASKLMVKLECSKNLEDSSYVRLRPMDTERRQFGVCELGGEIYIIGGQNDKDGCLARCQKFVPLYNSQFYIINSLNTRSSKHALTTYKNKYILKFGGVKKLLPLNSQSISLQDIAAPTEIYSVQTEEWSVIPIKRDLQVKFGLQPSIFKTQNKNMLLILGGQFPGSQRMTLSLMIQDSKGVVQQVKVKAHKSKLNHHGHIFNSTIRIDQEQNNCTFMSSTDPMQNIAIFKNIKLYK